ncbi:MAG: YaaL family protein [Sporolactobacillus sp.]
MLRHKKGKLRRELYDSLLNSFKRCRADWDAKKGLVEASIDPSEEVVHELKLAEARYFFILKEIRANQSLR